MTEGIIQKVFNQTRMRRMIINSDLLDRLEQELITEIKKEITKIGAEIGTYDFPSPLILDILIGDKDQ